MIPLVSDTETRPTEGMRRAIARADVGDEQRGEDPTVNALQERVADLLGKASALWFPGGTMCNFVAARVHTDPADIVIAEAMSHLIRAESAGVALSSGVLVEPIATERGVFTAADLGAALDRIQVVPSPYSPRPRLVCVEQTHNFGGGSVWSLEELESVSGLARERGLAVHMDGARLLNACTATGVSAARFAALTDSVWIDFTKGLGAPIGAVLAGSADFIAQARRQKHVFGGAMRQAGIAAAGCLYALDHHVQRLAEDHAHARLLADGLAVIPGVEVRFRHPQTNMVFFAVPGLGLTNAEFLPRLMAKGVRVGRSGPWLRAVTHLDVSRNDVERSIHAVAEIAREQRGAA